MSTPLPIFPLGSVVFPGAELALHVFEDRYRELMTHLLAQPEDDRRFGIVAIREGYEVGDTGVQSAHRVGVEVRLTDVEAYDDGRFDIEVMAKRRIRMDAMISSDSFIWAQVEILDDSPGRDVDDAAGRARAVFGAYRDLLRSFDLDSTVDELPSDPGELSYALAQVAVLTMRDRQGLLEAPDDATRLRQFTRLLVSEISAMRVIPSLPAVEVARTSWSPN
ncbi:MAG: LON peptidase substrate-binding domain-containing protein [Nocardioidaceae bacterium]|nr:LON peptidase substrate-binding domain-containing protein [Nocardioidaceae bacterium]